MPNYWVAPVNEDNYFVCREFSIFGVKSGQGWVVGKVKPGDALVIYVPKRGCKSMCASFVGAYEIVSDWFEEEKPLWPDERVVGKAIYTHRVKIKPIAEGLVKAEELISKLSFIRNKERWILYLMGTLGNLRRPIPEEDAEKIINALRKSQRQR